jgi:hypothetical protein
MPKLRELTEAQPTFLSVASTTGERWIVAASEDKKPPN